MVNGGRLVTGLPQWNMQRNFHVGNQQFLACNIFQHQQLQQYGGVSGLQLPPMSDEERKKMQSSANTTRKIVSEANKILFSNARRHKQSQEPSAKKWMAVRWKKEIQQKIKTMPKNRMEIKKNCLVLSLHSWASSYQRIMAWVLYLELNPS